MRCQTSMSKKGGGTITETFSWLLESLEGVIASDIVKFVCFILLAQILALILVAQIPNYTKIFLAYHEKVFNILNLVLRVVHRFTHDYILPHRRLFYCDYKEDFSGPTQL